MAWYNPSTWTVVDNLQGQNNNGNNYTGKGGGGWGSTSPTTTETPWYGTQKPLQSNYAPIQEALPVADPTASATGANNPAAIDYINQSYNTKLAGLQGIYDTLNPQQDAAVLNVMNQYQNQANSLQTQNALGQRNLKVASDQVAENKARSISDLTRQVQTMGRSYQNQLGAYGAGDSSAAGMLNQALSGQASRNRSNVMYNAANQQRGIDMQGQDLKLEFDNNLKALDDWKSTSLNDIASKFLQQRQSIQQQMQTANADRYQALANMDQQYLQQAMAAMADLESRYRSDSQNLVAQYQNLSSPQYTINPQLQQYAVQPISSGQLQQYQLVPGLSNYSNPTPVNQRRSFQEDYGF